MEKLLLPFYKFSFWFLKKIPIEKFSQNSKKTENYLKGLFYGQKKITLKEYYAQKLAVALAILFWGFGAVLFVRVAEKSEPLWIADRSLARPTYGAGARETELEVYIEGETESTLVPIQVSERRYTAVELQKIFMETTTELSKEILGKNKTLDEVRCDLALPVTTKAGTITVEWILNPADIIDERGKIVKEVDEKGVLVELKAVLGYGNQTLEYRMYAHVYPPQKTSQEAWAAALKQEMDKADKEGIYEKNLMLPSQLEGKQLHFGVPRQSTAAILAGMVLLVAVIAFWRRDKNLEKMAKVREQQLILDYPELLFKLTMLLGAGLTIRMAFSKIALEYQEGKGKRLRYAYEEMLLTHYEIQSGVGESTAYENFGKRCREPHYVKLGSLLAQNLKRGARGLRELLEGEAIMGMEERKNIAKKLGEEAGTKLLIPMMLMLVVVLIILVAPAIMAL